MKSYLYFGLNLERRRNRRLLVAGMVVGVSLILMVEWLAGLTPDTKSLLNGIRLTAYLPPFLLVGLSYYGLCQALRAYSYPGTGEEHPDTDERQAHVRDRSFVISYQILATLLSLGVIYLLLAPDFQWPLLHDRDAIKSLFWSALFFTASLPTAVIGWMEPGSEDEPKEIVALV